MLGWVICRLKENEQDISVSASASTKSTFAASQSIFNEIYDLTYGVLSNADYPPQNSWVFLAKGKSTVVLQGLSAESMHVASLAPISLERVRIKNDALFHSQENAFIRGFAVSGSPIAEINGTYLEKGSFNGVAKYEHIRKWTIMRCQLPEIEELGISAADTYESMNMTRMEKFFDKADRAYDEIVDNSSTLHEGSSQFKNKFLDIARAGTRLVTADLTLQTLRQNDLRSALRAEQSAALLAALAANALNQESKSDATNFNVSAPLSSLDDPRLFENSESLFDHTTAGKMMHSINEDNWSQSAASDSSSLAALQAATAASEEFLETQLVLNKAIHYQETQVPFLERDLVRRGVSQSLHGKKLLDAQSVTKSKDLAEAELTSEVITAIEERENAIAALQAVASDMERLYLDHGLSAAEFLREKAEEAMNKVRLATIDLSEAYGAWARISAKASLYQTRSSEQKKSNNNNGQEGAEGDVIMEGEPRGRDRPHAVVIAHYGVGNLIESSKEMKSNVKKFSRGFEGAVKPVELKYVGIYSTRDEAIQAFEEAMRAVPEEQLLPSDRESVNQAFIALRACHKHYLVRSSGVKADIPCEQCEAEKSIAKKIGVEKLYKNHLPPFIYKQKNYFEKLWADLSISLKEYRAFQRVFGEIPLDQNPFLLEIHQLEQLQEIAKNESSSGKNKRSKKDIQKEKDPLHELKGQREKLHDALLFSKTCSAQILKEEKLRKFTNHPFQPHRTIAGFNQTLIANMHETSSSRHNKRKMITSSSTGLLGLRLSDSLSQSPLSVGGLSAERLTRALKILAQNRPQSNANSHFSVLPLQHRNNAATEVDLSTMKGSTAEMNNNNNSNNDLARDGEHHAVDIDPFDIPSLLAVLSPPPLTALAHQRASLAIDTDFHDHGATQTLSLSRFAPAFREEELFCRTDVGEFASFAKGRAVRALEFHEQLLAKGKEKEAFRKRLQLMLRKAISVHVVHCNVDGIRALIEIANNTRSSTLALDVKQAEQFIIHHFNAIALAQTVQRVFRGRKARERVKEMRRAIERERVYRQLTREQAFLLSNSLVPPLVDSVRERKHKERLREHFSFSLNLSGCFAFARVFERETAFRKPISLCLSCQTKILVKRENPCVKGEIDVQRSVCTCRDVRSPEQWLVRFYFPLQQRTISRTFSLQEVRSVVLMLEQAKQELFFSPERVSEKVKGEYLGELEPLFPHVADSLRNRQQQKIQGERNSEKSRKYLTSRERMREQERERRSAHVVQRSFSKAWLQSARESAVLARLPPSLPERVLNLFSSQKGREAEEKERERIRGEMETSLHFFDAEMRDNDDKNDDLSIVPHHRDSEKYSKKHNERWRWEPLRTLSLSRNSITLLEERVAYAQARLAISQKEWEAEQARERENLHALEVALMEREDMHSHLFNLASELYLVTLRNEEIHAFERALNEEREALEQQMKLDVTRSYDMFEDGAAWKELHKRQKLLREFNEWWGVSERVGNTVREKESLWREQQMLTSTARERVSTNESELMQLSFSLAQLQSDVTVQRSDVKLTMRMFLNAFSFPKKLFLQGERGLQYVPLDLVFIRDPVERLRLQHRHCLQGVYRRIMSIRSSHKSVRESAIRCVVSVFEDAVTGNVLLTLEGNEGLTVEEGMQVEDLQVASSHVFSSLQQFIQKNEIVLTPQEVEIVLRRPVEEELHRETTHSITAQEVTKSPHERERNKHMVRHHRKINNREPFVAPSQRPRSLAHITIVQQNKRVYVRKDDNENANNNDDKGDVIIPTVSTYTSRQAEKERNEREKASELVRRLRIHPYTGRPCLGVLHFLRRRDLALSALHDSLWFSDTLAGNPLRLSNTVYDEIHTFSDKERVRLQLSEHVHRLEVTLTRLRPSLAVSHSARIQIPARDILRSLCEYGEPLRVTSFLARLSTGQYSSYLAEHCLAHILSILPGEGRVAKERARFWMRDELPAFLFQTHLIDTYRGPHCALHRFVCGVYVKVQLYVRERGRERDWLLEFSRPDDDEFFWAHRFRGQRVRVYLAYHEIVSFIVRTRLTNDESICNDAQGMQHARENMISLLHPMHIDKLLNHVLDRLVFIKGLCEPPAELSHHKALSVNGERVKASQHIVLEDLDEALSVSKDDNELSAQATQAQRHVVLQTREMKKHVSLCLSRFNHWITERQPSLAFSLSIPERDIERLADEANDICRMPKWALSESFSMPREGETPDILIGAGFWGFPNKRVFALFRPSSRRTNAGNEKENASGRQPETEKDEDIPSSSGNLSFYRVTMHSSLDKQSLSVSLFPSTLDSASGEMERLLLQSERVSMRSEDARSHQVEELVKHKQASESECVLRQLQTQQEQKDAQPTTQDQSFALEVKQKFAMRLKLEKVFADTMSRFGIEFSEFLARLLKNTNTAGVDSVNAQIFSFSPAPAAASLRFRLVFVAVSSSREKARKSGSLMNRGVSPFEVKHEVLGTRRESAFRDAAAWARVNYSLSIPSHLSSYSKSAVSHTADDSGHVLFQRRTGRIVRCEVTREISGGSEGERRKAILVSQCERVRADGVALCDLVDTDSLAECSFFAVPVFFAEGEEIVEEIDSDVYSSVTQALSSFFTQRESDNALNALQLLLRERHQLLPHTVIHQHISKTMSTRAISSEITSTHSLYTQIALKKTCADEGESEGEDIESTFDIDHSLHKLIKPHGRISSSFYSLNATSQAALSQSQGGKRTNKKKEKGGHKHNKDHATQSHRTHSTSKSQRGFVDISRSESDGERERDSLTTKQMHRQRAKLIFVPFDEALPHKEIDCDFADCQRVICETFLTHFAEVSEVHHSHSHSHSHDHTHATSHNTPVHFEVSTQTHRLALSRSLSPSVLLYAPTAQRRTHNVRTACIASELFPKEAGKSDSLSLSLSHCNGDALLLIRNGERDYERIGALLRRMYAEYLPAMLLRKEKAGREREWRKENHQKYKQMILSLANRFLPIVEKIFTEKHCLTDRMDRIDSVVVAQLFRWFDDKYHGTPTGLRHRLQNDAFTADYHWLDDDELSESERICAESHHTHDMSTQDKHTQYQSHTNAHTHIHAHAQTPAERLAQSEKDKDRARHADMLRCFDAPFSSSFFDIDSLFASVSRFLHVLLRKKGTADQRNTHRQNEAFLETFSLPSAFSPGQLVYALYQRHCHACALPPSTCPFPGCGKIRLRARMWEETNKINEGDEKNILFSGAHAIEREIRMFFSNSRVLSIALRNSLRVDGLPLIEIETAEEDIALEKDRDHTELQRYTSAQRLQSHWRQSLTEAQYSELLQELLLSPESRASGLAALDVLRARGGLHQLDRERLLRVLLASLRTHKGKEREKLLPFLKAISEQERSLLRHAEDSHSASRTLSIALRARSAERQSAVCGLLTVSLLQRVLDTKAHGGKIDIYPDLPLSHSSVSDKLAMPLSLFHSVLHRLIVCVRREHDNRFVLIEDSVHSTGSTSAELVLCWDRLLFESVVRLRDASIVVLTLLAGVSLRREDLVLRGDRGVPDAGFRFAAVCDDSIQCSGWTLVIHDTECKISRCAIITERDIERFAEGQQLCKDDWVQLAKQFMQCAARCVSVSRIAGHCTGVAVDLQAANPKQLTAPPVSAVVGAHNKAIRYIGARQMVISRALLFEEQLAQWKKAKGMK